MLISLYLFGVSFLPISLVFWCLTHIVLCCCFFVFCFFVFLFFVFLCVFCFCFLFVCFFVFFVLWFVHPMLSVSMDCPFLIAPSDLSNFYSRYSLQIPAFTIHINILISNNVYLFNNYELLKVFIFQYNKKCSYSVDNMK